MLQFLGIILIVNVIIFDLWWLCSEKSLSLGRAGFLGSLTIVVVIAGLVLIFNERAMNVVFGKNSKISIASKQAQVDAEAVSEIRKQVEAQRATIDLVATEATDAKKLSVEVAAKNVEAGEKLVEIDKALNEAKTSVSSLEVLSLYQRTVLAAQGNDRFAYNQLLKWSEDVSFPFRNEAAGTYYKIMNDHSSPMYSSGFTVSWKEGIDPSALTINQLIGYFFSTSQTTTSDQQCGLLEYICSRDDIPKLDRLDFYVLVMKQHRHLGVCEYAGRYFTKLADLKIKPLALNHLVNWWYKNRDKFKDGDADKGSKQ